MRDALFFLKMKQAKQYDIQWEYDIVMPSEIHMKNGDLAVLHGKTAAFWIRMPARLQPIRWIKTRMDMECARSVPS